MTENNLQELLDKYPAIAGVIQKFYDNLKDKEKPRRVWISEIKDWLAIGDNPSAIEALDLKGIDKESLGHVGCSLPESKEDLLYRKRQELGEIYEQMIRVLKFYMDMNEETCELVSIWSIGANIIHLFECYPYLFINAPKGSGKTRLLKIICAMTGGKLLNSLREATLFRTNYCLGIDEFESITRKGIEDIRELLNSAYKKGTCVIRSKEVKNAAGNKEFVQEEFNVYRPIVMANISGMENVLADRCFQIILDRSNNPLVTKRIELFEKECQEISKRCKEISVDGGVDVGENVYVLWHDYLNDKYQYTIYTHTLPTPTPLSYEKYLSFFNKIDESGINARSLELSFPLLILANFLSSSLFEKVLSYLKKLDQERKREDITTNYDILLLDFTSGLIDDNRSYSLSNLTADFKRSANINDDFIGSRWVSAALRRLNILLESKRRNYGMEIRIDISKAQEKLKIYKPDEKEVSENAPEK